MYIVTFLPVYFRLMMNGKKWLWYGQKLQVWNCWKCLGLMAGPITFIIYQEIDTHPRRPDVLLYLFFTFRILGAAYKNFWDLYYDFGLFRGTRPDNRLLRDKMKFHPYFYYFAMFINTLGLYFWVIVILLYSWASESS